MKVLTAPKEVWDLIEEYRCLKFCSKCVNTPYFINTLHRHDLRSLVGKGLPEEIQNEVLIWAKLRGIDICKLSESEIRNFMQKEGIGIDCSGFVYHVLDRWAKTSYKRSISKFLKYPRGLKTRLAIWIRPAINTSADTMTNNVNTEVVSLKDVRPGDLLRLKALTRGDHIAIVIEVKLKNDAPNEIVIAQSTQHYGVKNGIKLSLIKIEDLGKSLLRQRWMDVDKDGVSWTKKQLEKDSSDNGLKRLKFIKLPYNELND